MLQEVFGTEPLVLKTSYDSGISYLVGPTSNLQYVEQFPELRRLVINDAIPSTGTPLPSDDWPFLYLRERAIPFVYLFTLTVLLLFSFYWVRRLLANARSTVPQSSRDVAKGMNVLMFLLGSGFMLMEVKSISDLSLLFGSTWLVNSVAIASILLMILLANAIVIRWQPSSMAWVYGGLACSLTWATSLSPLPLRHFLSSSRQSRADSFAPFQYSSREYFSLLLFGG